MQAHPDTNDVWDAVDLRHLRYFVAVAEELHFGRAAQRLRISQPPLSVQIRDLEHELGVKLFDRSRHRIALTHAGRLLLDRARALLDGAARLKSDLRAALEGDAGELRIAFTQSSEFVAFLPEALRQFREAFPHVELRLRECASEEQVRLIGEREIDVGIARRPRRKLSRLVAAEALRADPLVLALRADDPLASQPVVALREIADRPLICLPRNEGTGLQDAVVALCQSAGFAPRIDRVAGQLLTVVGLVAAGFGVAVVPASLESVRREGVVFRAIRDKGASSVLYILTHSADDSRLTSAFRRILLDRVRGRGDRAASSRRRRVLLAPNEP